MTKLLISKGFGEDFVELRVKTYPDMGGGNDTGFDTTIMFDCFFGRRSK